MIIPIYLRIRNYLLKTFDTYIITCYFLITKRNYIRIIRIFYVRKGGVIHERSNYTFECKRTYEGTN